MAAWTDFATLFASLAAGKAVTDEKLQALAENVVALAEGAPDAVVLRQGWHPYDMVDYGDGADGVIYDFAVDGAVASVTSPTFAAGFEYAFDLLNLSMFDGLTIEANRSVSGWSAPYALVAGTVTQVVGYVECLRATKSQIGHVIMAAAGVASGFNAIAPETILSRGSGAAQTLTAARFGTATGNITAGKIVMYKRLIAA